MNIPILLTAQQVAEILQLSPSKVYKMIQWKEIPSIRIGRAVRVQNSDLVSFIQKNKDRNI